MLLRVNISLDIPNCQRLRTLVRLFASRHYWVWQMQHHTYLQPFHTCRLVDVDYPRILGHIPHNPGLCNPPHTDHRSVDHQIPDNRYERTGWKAGWGGRHTAGSQQGSPLWHRHSNQVRNGHNGLLQCCVDSPAIRNNGQVDHTQCSPALLCHHRGTHNVKQWRSHKRAGL